MIIFFYQRKDKHPTCHRGASPPPPPLQHSTLYEHSTTQFPFDTGRFYRTKESYVLFEVIEIYVHPYENIVTKSTRGTPVKFLPLQSEYINT